MTNDSSSSTLNNTLVGASIGIFPLALTACKPVVPALICLLLWIAVIQWLSRPPGQHLPRPSRAVALTWSIYALVMLALTTWHGMRIADWDNASRFLIVALLLYGLAWGSPSPRAFVVSCCTAQIGMLTLSLFELFGDDVKRAGLSTNPIQLGNLAVLWGIAALPWCREPTLGRSCRCLAGLAFCTAIVVAGLSGTRGVFLSLCVCTTAAIAWIVWQHQHRRAKRPWRATVLVATAVVATVAAIIWLVSDTHMVARSQAELRHIANGDFNTSFGLRILMWKAAWNEFLSSPLLGGGDFSTALTARMNQVGWPHGRAGFGHAHSDWLQMLATFGIVGLTTLAAIFLVPAVAACRASKNYHSLHPAVAALWLSLLFVSVSMTTQTLLAHQNGSLGYALLIGTLSMMLPKNKESARS